MTTEFIVRRNSNIVAVLSGQSLPQIGARLVFGGDEFQVIAVKHIYTGERGQLSDAIIELDPPEVHVNHIRKLVG